MIDLARLTIKKGDIVRRKYNGENGNYQPFEVNKIEISANTLEQIIYPEFGEGIPASELEIVYKDDSDNIIEKNKIALESILNSIYKDEWDIQRASEINFNFGDACSYVLIIHYPEIIISNSCGSEHLIRDLYILIGLTKEYRFSTIRIIGFRGSFTDVEQNNSYSHSHLSCNTGKMGIFCTGGDILDDAMLNAKIVHPSSDGILYEQFFELLNVFVRWESLEGGPYRRISNLRSSKRRFFTSHITGNKISTLFNILYNKDYKLPLMFNFNALSKRKYTDVLVLDNTEFKSMVKKVIIENMDYVIEQGLEIDNFLGLKENNNISQISNINELRSIISKDKEDKEDKELYTINTVGTGDLKFFKGNKILLKRYSIIDNPTNFSVEDIVVPEIVVKKTEEYLKLKFYGNFFEREGDFIEELKSPVN